MKTGTLYLVVGASGSGKDTVINNVAQVIGNVFVPLKYTTRNIREGEVQEREYHFINEDQFAEMEFFTKYGVYGANYGVDNELLAHLEKGEDVLLNISNRLTTEIREKYAQTKIVYVFVSLNNLRNRILGRKRENDEEVNQRLKRAEENLQFLGNADYILDNNGSVEDSIKSTTNIIFNNRIKQLSN